MVKCTESFGPSRAFFGPYRLYGAGSFDAWTTDGKWIVRMHFGYFTPVIAQLPPVADLSIFSVGKDEDAESVIVKYSFPSANLENRKIACKYNSGSIYTIEFVSPMAPCTYNVFEIGSTRGKSLLKVDEVSAFEYYESSLGNLLWSLSL